MKYLAITLALLTLLAQNAFACLGEEGVCRGDRVIPEAYNQGYAIVKAINWSTGIATVKGNKSANYHRYNIGQLGITNGCMRGLCVGYSIIPDNFLKGYATVEAINYHTKNYTVKGNLSANYNRYTRGSISFMQGCLDGLCVGDKVIPDAYSTGYAIIKAVNPKTGIFTVKGNKSANYHRYRYNEMALLEECSDYNSEQRYSYEFE